MRRTPEQLEAELMAEAKVLIAELVAWERQAGAPKLSQIEEKVLVVRQQLGPRLLKAMIEDQEARQPAAPPQCPTCGAEMRYKGPEKDGYRDPARRIRVNAATYHCADCEGGFPPGSAA